jgi:hypothetical protein
MLLLKEFGGIIAGKMLKVKEKKALRQAQDRQREKKSFWTLPQRDSFTSHGARILECGTSKPLDESRG